jgi:hypothetical protein
MTKPIDPRLEALMPYIVQRLDQMLQEARRGSAEDLAALERVGLEDRPNGSLAVRIPGGWRTVQYPLAG